MSLPVTVPFTFGNATTTQSLSSLDTNFTTIKNAVNGLTNGASQINVASISATGTANSTTYLRGDGVWATVSGGGGGNGTVTSVNVNGGTTGLTTSGGPVTGSGNITISGTLVAANGGTGLTAVGASGNVLTSNGTAWVSQTPTTSNGAKAWCSFDGTAAGPTITPAASYNVTSITKNGTGDYTINFTSALTNANYAWSGSCPPNGAETAGGTVRGYSAGTQLAGSCRIITRGQTTTAYDTTPISFMCFGS